MFLSYILRFCPEPLLHLVKRPPARLPHSSGSDNAVKTLQDIQKDIRHFLQLQDKLNDAEKEKEDALIEKMKKRMEMLDNRCRQEGKRPFEARYYGSAALKDILENSDEFSGLVEPDEDGAPPNAIRENEEAGQ